MTTDDGAKRSVAGGTQGDPLRQAMHQVEQEGSEADERPDNVENAQSLQDDRQQD